MTIEISIPTPLRNYTNSKKRVEVNGDDVSTALQNLVDRFPRLKNHLYDEDKLRNFVNIYVNDEDVRYLEKKHQTPLKNGDKIAIIPSIAGGM